MDLSEKALKQYADWAEQALQQGHLPSPSTGVTEENIKSGIQTLRDGLENDQRDPNVAYTVGFATEYRSLDRAHPSQAHQDTLAGYTVFSALCQRSRIATQHPFFRDVAFVTEYHRTNRATEDLKPSAEQKKVLSTVLDTIKEQAALGAHPVVIIDLDETIFNLGPRFAEIAREYAVKQDLDPHTEDVMRTIHPNDLRYNLQLELPVNGVDDPKILADFDYSKWSPRLLSGLAAMDPAVPGAPEYVTAMREAGATIVYLSGRPEDMRDATVAGMYTHGFPMPDPERNVHLILKSSAAERDKTFKQTQIETIAQWGKVVASFDNEPWVNKMMLERFGKDHLAVNVGTVRSPYPDKVLIQDLERIPDDYPVMEVLDLRR